MKKHVMILHWILFRQGRLDEARMVLRLLRKGVIRLGLDDVSRVVEEELVRLRCCDFYGNGNGSLLAYLKGE